MRSKMRRKPPQRSSAPTSRWSSASRLRSRPSFSSGPFSSENGPNTCAARSSSSGRISIPAKATARPDVASAASVGPIILTIGGAIRRWAKPVAFLPPSWRNRRTLLPNPSRRPTGNLMEESRSITRKSASNLALAFVLLPKEKRDGMTALYAFCREVDDVADEESVPVAERRSQLAAWREDIRRACAGGNPEFGVNRELQGIIRQHPGLSFELFDDL